MFRLSMSGNYSFILKWNLVQNLSMKCFASHCVCILQKFEYFYQHSLSYQNINSSGLTLKAVVMTDHLMRCHLSNLTSGMSSQDSRGGGHSLYMQGCVFDKKIKRKGMFFGQKCKRKGVFFYSRDRESGLLVHFSAVLFIKGQSILAKFARTTACFFSQKMQEKGCLKNCQRKGKSSETALARPR